MKKNLLWQCLTVAAVAAPAVYQWAVWPALPALVPTHFNHNGQADGYTSREHLWLLTVALPVGTALLLTALPHFDPKQRLNSSSANYQKLRLAVVGLLSGLVGMSIYTALHPGAAPGRGLGVLLGLFLAFMGNYLTTVQPNYFVGIRTPWTLESPVVWARTHRVGGMLLCLVGVVLAGLALVLPPAWATNALVVAVLASVAFTYGYSYFLFRRLAAAGKAA